MASSNAKQAVAPTPPGTQWSTVLQHRVIMIGGAGAIGSVIAKQAALQGALVAIGDIDKQQADLARDGILQQGGTAISSHVDISNEQSVIAWVDHVYSTWGRVDVLVNNAAIFIYGSIEAATEDDWDRVLSVNVKGFALCCKHVVPKIKLGGRGGSIVNISSKSGIISQANYVPYCTSKAAIIQMTKNLAHDLGQFNIRVNSVSPGTIDTAQTISGASRRGFTRETFTDFIVKDLFIKRLGDPLDIANAVIFLASDLSAFTTGTNLTVDGGFCTQ